MVKKSKKSPPAKKGRSLDVRSASDIPQFENILKSGPMTLIIVYADWCGYCKKRKEEFDSLMNMAGPAMNVVKLNDKMMPKTSMSSAKINGFPSAILVGPDKTPAVFKDSEGEVTNALPKSDTPTLEKIINQANSSTGFKSPVGFKSPAALTPYSNSQEEEEDGLATPPPMTANSSLGPSPFNTATPTPAATINTISSNLLPSAPPDALEDMVQSQKKSESQTGGAYRPGLFKELEAMARNGRWAIGRIQKMTRKLTGRKHAKKRGKSRRSRR